MGRDYSTLDLVGIVRQECPSGRAVLLMEDDDGLLTVIPMTTEFLKHTTPAGLGTSIQESIRDARKEAEDERDGR